MQARKPCALLVPLTNVSLGVGTLVSIRLGNTAITDAQVEQAACPGRGARWRRAAEALLGAAALSPPEDPGGQLAV